MICDKCQKIFDEKIEFELKAMNAEQDQLKNGVEIKTIQVSWNKQGQCHFIRNDLPISLTNGEFISE